MLDMLYDRPEYACLPLLSVYKCSLNSALCKSIVNVSDHSEPYLVKHSFNSCVIQFYL